MYKNITNYNASRPDSEVIMSCGDTTRGECLCYIQCIIVVFNYYNVAP